ncbi:MlaC/ttg2D family ABC transporter substrate-binding protein [Thalassotalea piscium]|uniref:ABC-type transporter MlaC component n=1 Tax=Thalassotalea piscium TaxID=1230533 RepID=A0A7X0TUC6_9GAMM|nr:ABC transporter substrate-binding protein [Thalassotalea piscium]MBB6543945.1 ABC-type transporter MlaC component [Thalassotalea piscium]
MKNAKDNRVNTLVVIFILLTLLISSFAMANNATPDEKVSSVFTHVETALIALKQGEHFNKVEIKKILTEYLLPEVNTRYFTYKVLGKHLAKVPDNLKNEFITELSQQLINSYTQLLSKYNNEAIKVGRSALSNSGKIATVNIEIIGQEKSNKAVVKLLQSENGNWQFFDIVVEGISLLQSKQNELNASINKIGIEETLVLLKKLNHNHN